MATKTEIKKWIKEIVTPAIEPYGYKFGAVKEFGNALAIYKKTKISFSDLMIDIYSNCEIQIGGIDFVNLILIEKIFNITNNKEVLRMNRLMYIQETHPYYEYVKKRDFSFIQIIKSKKQLEVYLHPLLDQFDDSMKLVAYYKYIPNLLQKWEEVTNVEPQNYELINSYFPSPFKYFYIYYLARLVNYKSSDKILTYSISIMDMIRREIIEEGDIEGSKEYDKQIQSMDKLKTYFNTISKEDFEQLQEDFQEFLIGSKQSV